MSTFPYLGHSIVVRPIEDNDMVLLHQWLKMPDFLFYRPYSNEISPTVMDLISRRHLLQKLSPTPEIEVLIEHRPTRTPIGVMALSGIDYCNRKAEFSMGFIRGQGTRCTMEALHYGLEQAFSTLNLRKIFFYVAPDNQRALRFMKHWQFRQEGFLLEELLCNDRPLDLYRYAWLQSEWSNSRLYKALRHTVPLA